MPKQFAPPIVRTIQRGRNRGVNFLKSLLVALVFVRTTDRIEGEKILPIQLQEGTTGVLPCQIDVTPKDIKEVTWKKVETNSNETLVILVVNVDKRSGRGHDDGLFNIRNNYCLEINKVKKEDEGQYFCEIKINANEIISSEWIVTVDVFDKSIPQPKKEILPLQLLVGKTGVLPCQMSGNPKDTKEVAWMKFLGPRSNETLAIFDVNADEISGPGHDDGLFNIRKDYCLEIYDVKPEDEGKYFCEVKNKANQTISSEWIIKVQVFGKTDQSNH